jgi:dCMP deaminase
MRQLRSGINFVQGEKMAKRESWDQYFMRMATTVATRGTCDRAHVGCVLVKDKHILTMGHNGSLPGTRHCDDVGHYMVNGHCKRTNHAELNAVIDAASRGISIRGADAFITHSPCLDCWKILTTAKINRTIFKEQYVDSKKFLADLYGLTQRRYHIVNSNGLWEIYTLY